MFSGIPGIPFKKLAVFAAAAEVASSTGAPTAGTGAAELLVGIDCGSKLPTLKSGMFGIRGN